MKPSLGIRAVGGMATRSTARDGREGSAEAVWPLTGETLTNEIIRVPSRLIVRESCGGWLAAANSG